MGRLFEFSAAWNTSFFIEIVIFSLIISFFAKCGINKCENRKASKCGYFIVVFFLLVFIETFRSVDTGIDTQDYIQFFYNVRTLGFEYAMGTRYGQFESGFNLYIYLISRISSSYTFLFFVNAVINSLCFIRYLHHFWKKNDSCVFLPLFVLNYRYYLSAMRSGLANSLILYSIVLYDEKKYKKSFLFAVIAALFHATAWINFAFLIVLFLYTKYKRKMPIRRFVFIAIAGMVLINFGISYIAGFLMTTRYHGYASRMSDGSIGYWYIIISAILSIIILFLQRKRESDYSLEGILNLMVLSVFAIYSKLGAYRIPAYYTLCRVGIYKETCNELNMKTPNLSSRIILKVFEFILVILYMLFRLSRVSSGFNYSFIWE